MPSCTNDGGGGGGGNNGGHIGGTDDDGLGDWHGSDGNVESVESALVLRFISLLNLLINFYSFYQDYLSLSISYHMKTVNREKICQYESDEDDEQMISRLKKLIS